RARESDASSDPPHPSAIRCSIHHRSALLSHDSHRKEGSTMALYAFDGTGNEDQTDDAFASNVSDFFQAYDDPLKNTNPSKDRGSLYIKGIGQMAHTHAGDTLASAFGFGGAPAVR